MKRLAIIGSTGSIGKQTLSVVKNNSDMFKVVSLSAYENHTVLTEQIKEFKPKIATLEKEYKLSESALTGVDFYYGKESYLNAIVNEVDLVVVALVGFEGLKAVLKAIELKKDVALANKESLVVGGDIVMKLAKENGVNILPIDSEHSAIWQSLHFDKERQFKRLIITASGGPFRNYNKKDLETVSVLDALNHPTWKMGKKITIDSATMMNKGLEVIEAHHLYNAPYEKIDVVVHKESIIHSLVEYEDNAIICQMSYPTMEVPISLALSYPKRLPTQLKPIDFSKVFSLNFEPLDVDKFTCFKIAVECGKAGGIYPAIMNGANEEAVKEFLNGKIKFTDISLNIERALNEYNSSTALTYENLLLADAYSRKAVQSYIK